jgi:hypothetical protein
MAPPFIDVPLLARWSSEIAATHRVDDHAGSAIVRARKPS